MIEFLPWFVVALLFWLALFLSIDFIYDKVMAHIERRRRASR